MGKRGLLIAFGLLAAGGCLWWTSGSRRPHGSLPSAPARAPSNSSEPAALLVDPAQDAELKGEHTIAEARLPRVAVAATGEEISSLDGTVVIHVRRSDTGGPAPAQFVLLLRQGEERPDSFSASGSTGGLGDAAFADEEGRCTFRIPAGVRARAISAYSWNGADEEAGVEPLSAGEVREVTLVVHGFQYWIRAEDASDGAALVGASVRVGSQRMATGAGGLAMLWCAEGDEDQAEVEAEGYGPATIAVRRPGHDTPDSALDVRLSRASCLSGLVLGPEDQPIEGAEITVSARGSFLSRHEHFSLVEGRGMRVVMQSDRHWSARTDSSGAFTLRGLAPSIFLQITVASGEWPEVSERMQLAPGEEKQVVYRLGPGVVVRGLVRDEWGQAIPGCLLWLRAGAALAPFAAEGPAPERGFRSDEEGRFEIEEVPLGEWALGPAPGSGYDPAPVSLLVPMGVPSVEIVVEVRGALPEAEAGQEVIPIRAAGVGRLAGRLVDDGTGKPVGGGVYLTGSDGELSAFSTFGESGGFAFENLPLGTVNITARSAAGGVACLTVEIAGPGTGNEDLVIRLRPGGQLALRFPLGEEGRRYRVLSGACTCIMESVGAEERVTPHVPVGLVSVELITPGGALLLSRQATVRAGETVLVDLSKGP